METDSAVAGLLRAARDGSAEAMGQALEACRGYLLHVARRELAPRLQAKASASDIVQETFLEAQRDFPRFEGDTEGELLAWLRRLLLNNLGDFTRRYRDTEKRAADREVPLAGDSSGGAGALVAAVTPPSGPLRRREQEQALHRAMARLPEDYRRVLLLRYQEGRPFEEIAERLGRSPNAARKLWARALEELERRMEASW